MMYWVIGKHPESEGAVHYKVKEVAAVTAVIYKFEGTDGGDPTLIWA